MSSTSVTEMDPTSHRTTSRTETALMDIIRKYCEINQKQEVSLESLLQYINEEIEMKFVDSQSVVKQLTGSLECESKNGWINFDSIHKVFISWLNQQSTVIQFTIIKPTAAFSDASTSIVSPKSQETSTLIHEKKVFKGANDRLQKVETIHTACNDCGRDRSCCEFWNDLERESRNEKQKIHYDQRVATLRELLAESEEFNSTIQNELESLRKTCNALKMKERYWRRKEQQFKEHEQQLTMMNNLLKEKNTAMDAEVQQLRNQLSHSKNEPENISLQRTRPEKKGNVLHETEKLLFETKQKLSRKEFELQKQKVLLQEREEKIYQLEQQNEGFQKKLLHSFEKSKPSKEDMCDVLLSPIKLDLSTQEELFATPPIINRYLSASPSTKAIAEVLSLKAELDAVVGTGPTTQEHASTQTSFITTTGDLSRQTSFRTANENISAQHTNITSHDNVSTQTEKFVIFKNISTQTLCFLDSENMPKERIQNLAIISSQNDCLKCCSIERDMEISQKEINDGSSTTDKSDDFSFCSTYEIEFFEVVDVSTQIVYQQ